MGNFHRLKHYYYTYRQYVPPVLLYHPMYFRLLAALRGDGETLRALRESQLRHILTVACRHVPFYREKVHLTHAELTYEPAQLLLGEFPYLTKPEVMQRQHDFLDERLDPRLLNYVTTSGSSGVGIGLWRSKKLADVEKAFLTSEWGRFGFSFDKSTYLRIGGDARRMALDGPMRRLGNQLMLSPYHLVEKHRQEVVATLNKVRPRFVHGYPSATAALADALRADELDFEVAAVFLVSEPAMPHQLAAIERLFRCPISISYGQAERCNLAFADYHHGRRSPYRFQSVYAVTENRLQHGAAEIVGTSLWNDVMPLIRYRTGDFGNVEANGTCATIEGREQEFLVDRHGHRIPGLSIMMDEHAWDFIWQYQIRQEHPGRIKLAVVPRQGRLSTQQQHDLLHAQRCRWGTFFDIELEQVHDIPLGPNGKRRLIDTSKRVTPAAAGLESQGMPE